MKIEEYGLIFKVTYSRQAPHGRGTGVFHYISPVINHTSYDFNYIEVKYHGDKLFHLNYYKNKYFTLHSSYLKEQCWIQTVRLVDYQPWILAIVKELLGNYHKNVAQKLNILLTEFEEKTPLPNIILELKYPNH